MTNVVRASVKNGVANFCSALASGSQNNFTFSEYNMSSADLWLDTSARCATKISTYLRVKAKISSVQVKKASRDF